MRKWIPAVTLASLALASAALASDPWKDKKPAEWKDSDVRKILTDSPWTRQYEVMSMQSQEPASRNAENDMTGSGSSASGGGGFGSSGQGGRRGRGNTGDTQPGQAITYVAEWYSSRTVRAARVKEAERNGSPVPPDSSLLKTPQNYQVLLRGGDISIFAKLGEEGLQKSSYLEVRKTRQRITPAKIIILQAGGRNVAVVFEFPKTSASGEPTVTSDEKAVDFVAGGDNFKAKFRFDVSRMVDGQGTDL